MRRPILTVLTCLGIATMGTAASASTYDDAQALYDEKEHTQAIPLFEQACEEGVVDACVRIEVYRRQGEHLAKDEASANAAFRKYCDEGNQFACSALGGSYYFGIGFEKELAKAVPLYRKACGDGSGWHNACGNLGVMYRDGEGGIAPSSEEALRIWSRSCESGNGYACYLAGNLLRTGKHIEVDLTRAIAVLKAGCDLDHKSSCNELGIAHWERKELSQAVAAYERTCTLGLAVGCRNAAFRIKLDVEDRPKTNAVAAFVKGCDLKDSESCFQAGWMLETAELVPKDLDRALKFYKTGCAIDADTRPQAKNCSQWGFLTSEGPWGEVEDLRKKRKQTSGYSERVKMTSRMVEILDELGHTNNHHYARILGNYAFDLDRIGRHREALEVIKRAYDLALKENGEAGAASEIHNYAHYAANAGETELAIELSQRAYHASQERYGDTDTRTFNSRRMVAINLHRAGRYTESKQILEEAIAFADAELGEGNNVTQMINLSLVETLKSLGELDRADALINEAIEYANSGKVIPYTSRFGPLHAKAAILDDLGLPQLAVQVYEKLSPMNERAWGPEHSATLAMRNNWAFMLDDLGRYAEAEALQRETVKRAIGNLGENDPLTLRSLSNLAKILGHQGRHEERFLIEQEVLWRRTELFGLKHRDTLVSKDRLAETLVNLGDLPAAESELGSALEISRELLGEDVPETLSRMGSLGEVMVARGKYAEAEPLLTKARDAQLAMVGRNNPGSVSTNSALATLYRKTDRHREAEEILRQMVYDLKRLLGIDHPLTLQRTSDLIRALLAQPGQRRFAYEYGVELAKGLRERTLQADSNTASPSDSLPTAAMFRLSAESAWPGNLAPGHHRTPELLPHAFRALQNAMDGPASSALATSAARRLAEQKGAEIGRLAQRRDAILAELGAVEKSMTDALVEQGARADALQSKLEARKEDLSGELAQIDQGLREDAPEYFALINAPALTPDEARGLLKADEAALIVMPAEFGTHVMVVTQNDLYWHRSDWTMEQVDRAARRLLWDVGASVDVDPIDAAKWLSKNEGAYPFDRTTAHALYRQIIAPIAAKIEGKTHLFIAAGGSLSSLPLAMLVTEKPRGVDGDPSDLRATDWFADDFAITQIPSLQALQFLRRFESVNDSSSPTTMIGFGDPMLDGEANRRGGRNASRSGGKSIASARKAFRAKRTGTRGVADVDTLRELARLPGTRTELLAIRDAMSAGEEDIFLGAQATETQLKSTNLSETDILVFATHGLLAGEVDGAIEPGLVFTPPENATALDDGYLAASEVAALKLDADWVILSACNTASSDGSQGAPGLSGLAKSFFFAGAHNLLASHWPVRDDVAALMTVRTIEIRRERPELSRAQALQAAMREIRNDTRADSADDSWAHPNAWAPFTLIGDGAL